MFNRLHKVCVRRATSSAVRGRPCLRRTYSWMQLARSVAQNLQSRRYFLFNISMHHQKILHPDPTYKFTLRHCSRRRIQVPSPGWPQISGRPFLAIPKVPSSRWPTSSHHLRRRIPTIDLLRPWQDLLWIVADVRRSRWTRRIQSCQIRRLTDIY